VLRATPGIHRDEEGYAIGVPGCRAPAPADTGR
jgi:hypothetical protein